MAVSGVWYQFFPGQQQPSVGRGFSANFAMIDRIRSVYEKNKPQEKPDSAGNAAKFLWTEFTHLEEGKIQENSCSVADLAKEYGWLDVVAVMSVLELPLDQQLSEELREQVIQRVINRRSFFKSLQPSESETSQPSDLQPYQIQHAMDIFKNFSSGKEEASDDDVRRIKEELCNPSFEKRCIWKDAQAYVCVGKRLDDFPYQLTYQKTLEDLAKFWEAHLKVGDCSISAAASDAFIALCESRQQTVVPTWDVYKYQTSQRNMQLLRSCFPETALDDSLVTSKAKEFFGDHWHYFASGELPLHQEQVKFFQRQINRQAFSSFESQLVSHGGLNPFQAIIARGSSLHLYIVGEEALDICDQRFFRAENYKQFFQLSMPDKDFFRIIDENCIQPRVAKDQPFSLEWAKQCIRFYNEMFLFNGFLNGLKQSGVDSKFVERISKTPEWQPYLKGAIHLPRLDRGRFKEQVFRAQTFKSEYLDNSDFQKVRSCLEASYPHLVDGIEIQSFEQEELELLRIHSQWMTECEPFIERTLDWTNPAGGLYSFREGEVAILQSSVEQSLQFRSFQTLLERRAVYVHHLRRAALERQVLERVLGKNFKVNPFFPDSFEYKFIKELELKAEALDKKFSAVAQAYLKNLEDFQRDGRRRIKQLNDKLQTFIGEDPSQLLREQISRLKTLAFSRSIQTSFIVNEKAVQIVRSFFENIAANVKRQRILQEILDLLGEQKNLYALIEEVARLKGLPGNTKENQVKIEDLESRVRKLGEIHLSIKTEEDGKRDEDENSYSSDVEFSRLIKQLLNLSDCIGSARKQDMKPDIIKEIEALKRKNQALEAEFEKTTEVLQKEMALIQDRDALNLSSQSWLSQRRQEIEQIRGDRVSLVDLRKQLDELNSTCWGLQLDLREFMRDAKCKTPEESLLQKESKEAAIQELQTHIESLRDERRRIENLPSEGELREVEECLETYFAGGSDESNLFASQVCVMPQGDLILRDSKAFFKVHEALADQTESLFSWLFSTPAGAEEEQVTPRGSFSFKENALDVFKRHGDIKLGYNVRLKQTRQWWILRGTSYERVEVPKGTEDKPITAEIDAQQSTWVIKQLIQKILLGKTEEITSTALENIRAYLLAIQSSDVYDQMEQNPAFKVFFELFLLFDSQLQELVYQKEAIGKAKGCCPEYRWKKDVARARGMAEIYAPTAKWLSSVQLLIQELNDPKFESFRFILQRASKLASKLELFLDQIGDEFRQEDLQNSEWFKNTRVEFEKANDMSCLISSTLRSAILGFVQDISNASMYLSIPGKGDELSLGIIGKLKQAFSSPLESPRPVEDKSGQLTKCYRDVVAKSFQNIPRMNLAFIETIMKGTPLEPGFWTAIDILFMMSILLREREAKREDLISTLRKEGHHRDPVEFYLEGM